MNLFYEMMNSVVRGTLYGLCLAINGYGIFLLFRFLFKKCRQLVEGLKSKKTD